VLLHEQDRSLWDAAGIAEGLRVLERASRHRRPGPFQLQAAIAGAHAEGLGWEVIERLYAELERHDPSPVVRLNRAVAVALAGRLEEGLALADAIDGLADYPYAPATRADLLRRLGRITEARAAYAVAIDLTANAPERRFLERRLASLDNG